jgi:hypothetical protein
VTPEPLNSILVAVFLSAIALFVLAGLALLVGVVAFLVAAGRYRRLRGRAEFAPAQVACAEIWLRRGAWGLAACVTLAALYVARAWVGQVFYDEIAQGLVPYSRAWWTVWSVSVPYYASLPAGAIGTVVVLLASRNLTRATRSAVRPDRESDGRS